jgi:hypothetical protein
MPVHLARESPKSQIDPQPYVEPALWGKRRVHGTSPYPRKAAKAAVDVLLALGYFWETDNGWQKP